MIQNLIDEISYSTDESNISVLNSLCDAYEKAYTIVENCDESDIGQFSVIQESVTDAEGNESNEGSKKPNILIRILKAIAAFFKTIVNSIKKLFNKDTDKIIAQLDEVADLDEATAEAVQQVLDDPESKEYEKCQKGGKFKYEPTGFERVCDRIYKDIKVIRDETNAICSIATKLAMYMGKELKMYGSLLDVIQPIIKRQKEANRVHVVIDKD